MSTHVGSVVAGKSQPAYGYTGEGSAATSATLNFPTGISFDTTGNMYITDAGSNAIRKVNTASPPVISTVIGSPAANAPHSGNNGPSPMGNNYLGGGYTGDNGPAASTTAVSCTAVNACLDLAGIQWTPQPYFNSDTSSGWYGPVTSPSGIAFDSAGNKYVADSANNVIRKVTPAGIITTVYGNNYDSSSTQWYFDDYDYQYCDFGGDGGSATSAAVRFCLPSDVVFDRYGNLFITDTGNNRIRKVSDVIPASHPPPCTRPCM